MEINWPTASFAQFIWDNFFLRGHFKLKAYKNKPRNLEQLRRKIMQKISLIKQEMLSNIFQSFERR